MTILNKQSTIIKAIGGNITEFYFTVTETDEGYFDVDIIGGFPLFQAKTETEALAVVGKIQDILNTSTCSVGEQFWDKLYYVKDETVKISKEENIRLWFCPSDYQIELPKW